MYEEHIKREFDDWVEFTLKSSNKKVDLLFYVDADYDITKEIKDDIINGYEGWVESEITCNDFDVMIYDEGTDKIYSVSNDSKELLNLGFTEEEIEEMEFIGYRMVEELLRYWGYTSDEDIKFDFPYNRKWDKMKFDYKFKL